MTEADKQEKRSQTSVGSTSEDGKDSQSGGDKTAPAVSSSVAKKKSLGDFFKKGFKVQSLFKKSVAIGSSKTSNLDLLDVDLIKNEVVILFDWRRNFFNFLVFIALAIGVVAEAYYLLSIWEHRQVYNKDEYLKSDIANIERQISNIKDESDKAVTFRNNLQNVVPIFRSHVYWNNFFSFLEENTLRDLYYLSFDGSTSGVYSLPSRVKDYRAINFQLDKMLQATSTVMSASIANEEVDAAAKPAGKVGVSFDLNLSVNPNIFTK